MKQRPTWEVKMLGRLVHGGHAGPGVEPTVTRRTPATVGACGQPRTNQKEECSMSGLRTHPYHTRDSKHGLLVMESTEPEFNQIFERCVILAGF